MKKLILAAVMVASLFIPGKSFSMDEKDVQFYFIEDGKEAVRNHLKDPKSAEFRNVYFFKGSGGIPVSCGEVNSKNMMGGYSGFQKFISSGKKGITCLQEEVSDFPSLWNRLCAR